MPAEATTARWSGKLPLGSALSPPLLYTVFDVHQKENAELATDERKVLAN